MALKQQVALVVGAASGIGLAIAQELLNEGANVTVCDVSASGEKVVNDLQKEFPNQSVLFVQADVRNEIQFEAAFRTTKTKLKRLDIVINCAGICDEKNWNATVDINLKGIIRGTGLTWKYMGKHEGGNGGTLINISSIGGFISMPNYPTYIATKHGVIGYSRSVGEPYHLNRTGVRVIAVCPGHTDTPLINNLEPATEELKEQHNALKHEFRVQKAKNVAQAVLHVLQNGDSGSVWVSEEENPAFQVEFPAYTDMRVSLK